MKATSVEVLYARKMQPQAYESADCSVKLSISFEDGTEDLDRAITDALDTVQAHVLERLGMTGKATPAAKPNPAAKAQEVNARDRAAAKAAQPTNDSAPQAEKEITNEDLTKAIAAAVAKMREAGVSDAGPKVLAMIEANLPEGEKKPAQAARLPQAARKKFLEQLRELVK